MDSVSGYKSCEYCGKAIPRSYEYSVCPACQENELFHLVRDFIRANTVNEFQVADHFNIPLRMVKHWIREGRIEYVEDPNGKSTLSSLSCMRCGEPVAFGTLCTKCRKLFNRNMHGYALGKSDDDSKMRFLDSPSNDKN